MAKGRDKVRVFYKPTTSDSPRDTVVGCAAGLRPPSHTGGDPTHLREIADSALEKAPRQKEAQVSYNAKSGLKYAEK